jgi:hypothetical protein
MSTKTGGGTEALYIALTAAFVMTDAARNQPIAARTADGMGRSIETQRFVPPPA